MIYLIRSICKKKNLQEFKHITHWQKIIKSIFQLISNLYSYTQHSEAPYHWVKQVLKVYT